MPGPGFGKGNAHKKPGVSEKYMDLKRKSAQAHESRMCPLDSDKERVILDLVRNSALDSQRKKAAQREVREWLSAARKGLDGNEKGSGVKPCAHPNCKDGGNEHSHCFLCKTRKRKPFEPELSVKLAAEAALKKFLDNCSEQLDSGTVRVS